MLEMWSEAYYRNVFLQSHLTGEEIAIGKEEERAFFFVAKKDKTQYLIPSEIIENGQIPFLATETAKIGYKGKAFVVIKKIKDVVIRAERTMTYKQMINSWMDYEHMEKDRFTLWKMVVDAAYSARVNLRVMTHPGWMKDSPVFTLGRLRGNCFAVNKPSLAKLKYLVNDCTRILGVNEVQKLDADNKDDLSKFYEDTGDFKTVYTNPTRSTGGTSEQCNINHLSTLTFSNFPDSKKDVEHQKEELFDYMFHPKISSRIFPLLFIGGSESEPACKQRFGHITERITQADVDEITNWLRNFIYYEQHGKDIAAQKNFKNNYFIKNTRWDRNFQAICERIKLYCDTQEEYNYWTKLLFTCHMEYLSYVAKFGVDEYLKKSEVIEEDVK